MIYPLRNKVMNYPWGTYDFIPSILGRSSSGKPQAELWMGAHPKAESEVEYHGRLVSLSHFLESQGQENISFLFKVLTAREPLSIQVHPNAEQAAAGFERENSQKIPLNHFRRNYKDDRAKPEIACALTGLWALAGFRPAREIADNMHMLCPESASHLIDALDETRDIKTFYKELMSSSYRPSIIDEAKFRAANMESDMATWIMKLHNRYPTDITQLAPAFLNILHLSEGEAVYFPAGLMHSYLEGNIVELMSNSDNVIRGGLTGKFIDLDELLDVTNFRPTRPRVMEPALKYEAEGLHLGMFHSRFQGTAQYGEILLCLDGQGTIRSGQQYDIAKGDSFFVPKGTGYSFEGKGIVYRATSTF